VGQDIDGEASSDHSGNSVSLSSDGSIVAIGANDNDGNGYYESGHIRTSIIAINSYMTRLIITVVFEAL
jgi:hypothetical protein